MNNPSVGPIGDTGAVRRAEPIGTGRPVQPGDPRGADGAIPGVQEFDRLELNTNTGVTESYAKFVVHKDSGVVSIKIIDARTDTVIREIPPEDVLDIVEQLQSYMKLRAHKRS
jgi:hypothetical protein